jgi:hypothetical protein
MTRVRHTAIAMTIVCAVAGALPASVEAAASYTVWTCRGPAGEPLPAAGWQPDGGAVADRSDTCAQGGALVAAVPAGRGAAPHESGGWRAMVPDGVQVVRYRLWRSAVAAGGSGRDDHEGGFYATVLEDAQRTGACFAEAGCERIGDPANPLSAANLVERRGVAVRSVGIAVGCAPNHSGRCEDTGGTNAELRLYRVAFDVSDPVAPVLAGGIRWDGPIVVPARDEGAGLRGAEARVDGRVVGAALAAGCREPYTRFAPCPAEATFALSVDTDGLAAGAHRLDVVLIDGAGNAATVASRVIRVAAPAPVPHGRPPETGPPAPPPAVRRLRIRLDRRRFMAGSGSITGRVLTDDSRPAPGIALAVERRWFGARPGPWRRVATVVTAAGGGFRTPVPRGARRLRFRVASTRVVSPAVDVLSRLGLRAAMRPRTLGNGEVVTVSGRLRRAGRSALGRTVEIQAIVHGRWQTVGRATADARGVYRWRYRFRHTLLEALYSFRTLVRGDSDRWPWPTISSRRMRVHVLP